MIQIGAVLTPKSLLRELTCLKRDFSFMQSAGYGFIQLLLAESA